MNYQEEISNLETKVNHMMEILGTRFEADYLEHELNQNLEDSKQTNQAQKQLPVKIDPQTFSQILDYMRQAKSELLKNKDLQQYFVQVNQYRVMLQNFGNYANNSLNIKDKVRLLLQVKDDLLILSQNILVLEGYEQDLETLKTLHKKVEGKFNEERVNKLKTLIERQERQNQEIIDVIEVYKDMVTYVNTKMIDNRRNQQQLIFNVTYAKLRDLIFQNLINRFNQLLFRIHHLLMTQ